MLGASGGVARANNTGHDIWSKVWLLPPPPLLSVLKWQMD